LPVLTLENAVGIIQSYILLYIRYHQDSSTLSIFYLRQAITHAMRIGLHKEHSYVTYQTSGIDDNILRVLWWFSYLCNVFEKKYAHDIIHVFNVSVQLPNMRNMEDFDNILQSFINHFIQARTNNHI
jgi:hypothetical protein